MKIKKRDETLVVAKHWIQGLKLIKTGKIWFLVMKYKLLRSMSWDKLKMSSHVVCMWRHIQLIFVFFILGF